MADLTQVQLPNGVTYDIKDNTKLPISTAGGIASCSGGGNNWYYQIATIKITTTYMNRPVVFEISGRNKQFSRLQIQFINSNTTDPDLQYFSSDGDNEFYIKKTTTSTWEVYGKYSEQWGMAVLHRITGAGADIGVTVVMTNIGTTLPSDTTQATYIGNVAYATSAGSATDSTKVAKVGDTVTGSINRASGGSWIIARDNCVVKQTKQTQGAGSSWNPVVGIKTWAGHWSFGTVGAETLCLSYDTDSNYSNNTNTSKVIYFPSSGSEGTLALTSQIPTNNNQLTNGAGYITSSGSCAYATNAGTVNNLTVQTAVPANAKFTDTTYTFANGTNGFTVTPSGGSAQTVTVTPSIANNITGSGTSGYIAKFNGGNTITNGPALGSSTTTFLRNDGQWATPASGGGNKIFTVTPTTPYSVGDLYIADDNNILVCNTARSSGSYDDDDWGAAVDAVDDDTMSTTIASEIAVVTGNSSDGGNVILRLNSSGIPYEVLITDSPTNITSNTAKIYRWDSSGLRYSSTGYNGTYTTIINSSGQVPTSVLTGNINAAVNTIQNFTAAMINGGKLERGDTNNSKGTIELKDGNGTVIAEVGNYGFKFYGPGSVGSRPYYVIDNSQYGIAGYTSAGTLAFKIATDEFRMPKAYIQSELNIGNMIKIVPTSNATHSGISFVAAT